MLGNVCAKRFLIAKVLEFHVYISLKPDNLSILVLSFLLTLFHFSAKKISGRSNGQTRQRSQLRYANQRGRASEFLE